MLENVLLLCANLGGDTDTIGAMAAAICGAAQGLSEIPEKDIALIQKSNQIDLQICRCNHQKGANQMGKGCIVIGAAMLDIVMEIDQIPKSGTDVYAKGQIHDGWRLCV